MTHLLSTQVTVANTPLTFLHKVGRCLSCKNQRLTKRWEGGGRIKGHGGEFKPKRGDRSGVFFFFVVYFFYFFLEKREVAKVKSVPTKLNLDDG